MKYTYDMPTEPGWYWFKQSPKTKAVIHYVRQYKQNPLNVYLVNDLREHDLSELHFEGISMWCKIPEPELPDNALRQQKK